MEAREVRGSQEAIHYFMTENPHTIEPHQSIEAARERMRRYKVTHLPVRSGGRLVGILSDRDLNYLGNIRSLDLNGAIVADVMITDPYCVGTGVPLRQVAAEMCAKRLGSALVEDELGNLRGIFTATDALKLLAHQ